MFDSIKKMFSRSSKQDQKDPQRTLIDEEIDEFERELQEKIQYMEERSSSSEVQQPDSLSKGGAMGKPSLITPEAKRRIEEN